MTEYKPNKRDEFIKELANQFLNILNEPNLDWHKGWNGNMLRPFNASSGRDYMGINRLKLAIIAKLKNYTDPRWMTYKAAQNNGWYVKKGEKGTTIEIWSPYDKLEKRNLSWDEYLRMDLNDRENHGVYIYYQQSTVFNAAQISGIPEYLNDREAIDNNELIDKLSTNMGVKINYVTVDSAYYRPDVDEIFLPLKKVFKSEYDLNATALHELAHASGAESRLNRFDKSAPSPQEYAKEELVAELTSLFMGFYCGGVSDYHINNHKAYVQGWARRIKDDPNFLIEAMKKAEICTHYLEYKGEIITEKEYQRLTHNDLPSKRIATNSYVPDNKVVEERKKIIEDTIEDLTIQNLKELAEYNNMDYHELLNMDVSIRNGLAGPNANLSPEINEVNTGISLLNDNDFNSFDLNMDLHNDGYYLHVGDVVTAIIKENQSISKYEFTNEEVAKLYLEDLSDNQNFGYTYFDYLRTQKYLNEHPIASLTKARNETLIKPSLEGNMIKNIAGVNVISVYRTLERNAAQNIFDTAVISDGTTKLEIYFDKESHNQNKPSLEIKINDSLAYSDVSKANYDAPYQAYIDCLRKFGNNEASITYVSNHIDMQNHRGNNLNKSGDDTGSGNGFFDPHTGDIRYDNLPEEHELLIKMKKEQGRSTVVLNIYGGPGIGKTDIAKSINEILIGQGYSSVYISEYAKELASNDKNDELLNGSEKSQFDILVEQMNRLDEHMGEVDFIITDAPILMNLVYLNDNSNTRYDKMVKDLASHYDNFNIHLARDTDAHPYSKIGRIHDIKGARDIDRKMNTMFTSWSEDGFKAFSYKRESILSKLPNNLIKHLKQVRQNEKRTINRSRNVDIDVLKDSIPIVDYARTLGLDVVKASRNTMTTLQHDSLNIYENNTWYRWSNHHHGDIVDFIQEFDPRATDFKSALALANAYYNNVEPPRMNVYSKDARNEVSEKMPTLELTSKESYMNSILNDKLSSEPKYYFNINKPNLPDPSANNNRVIDYLNKTRCIDKVVISNWIEKGLLYQNKMGSAVFLGKDFTGDVKYGFIRGTSVNAEGKRFVQDVENSVKFVGVSYDAEIMRDLYITEGVIDAMSIQTLMKSEGYANASFLSVQGVGNLYAVPFYLATHDTSQLRNIHICFDNDDPGRKATSNLREALIELKALRNDDGVNAWDISDVTIKVLEPRQKDFNDELIASVRNSQSNLYTNTQSIAPTSQNQFKIYQRINNEYNDVGDNFNNYAEIYSDDYVDGMDWTDYLKNAQNNNLAFNINNPSIITIGTKNSFSAYEYSNGQFIKADWFVKLRNESLKANASKSVMINTI